MNIKLDKDQVMSKIEVLRRKYHKAMVRRIPAFMSAN